MENASTALIIASSILIAMLIISLMVFIFQTVSSFAQKQVTAENISEIRQFNHPYIEFQSKAGRDFLGSDKGALAEDVLNIANYTMHINETTGYRVNFVLRYDSKRIASAEAFTREKQQEFVEYDLVKRENNNTRLKYTCTLRYDNNDLMQRVNFIEIEIK